MDLNNARIHYERQQQQHQQYQQHLHHLQQKLRWSKCPALRINAKEARVLSARALQTRKPNQNERIIIAIIFGFRTCAWCFIATSSAGIMAGKVGALRDERYAGKSGMGWGSGAGCDEGLRMKSIQNEGKVAVIIAMTA